MNLAARMGNSVQYRSNTPLSNDQIARIAPSVFAEEAHTSRSARYTYIPTINVIDGLRKEGFQPFMVAQGRTRVPGKEDFTKHMLRLRREGDVAKTEANEIILINSHDGTSSYQMLSGLLRFVCCNGLVCGENMKDLRIPHKGDIVDNVIQGAYEVLDGFEYIRDVTENMKALRLTDGEQLAFASAALEVKFPTNDEEPVSAPIQARALLTARRSEDRDASVWATFNRIQENVIRGGLAGRNANGRRMRTREITSVDGDVKTNRSLWILAEAMAALKA